MLSKKEYVDALLTLGFVRESASRTDGSHIRFHHPKYPNLYCGITDHKNTKEMSTTVHKDIIKTLATFMWFEFSDENNFIDFDRVKSLLKKVDDELTRDIIKLLKKADGKDVVNIVTQRLRDEVSRLNENVTYEEISCYIQ